MDKELTSLTPEERQAAAEHQIQHQVEFTVPEGAEWKKNPSNLPETNAGSILDKKPENQEGVPVFKEPEVKGKVEKSGALPDGAPLIAQLTGEVIAAKEDIDRLTGKDPQAIMDAVMKSISAQQDSENTKR